MPLRVPPGRAGRPWLLHRLEVARAGADVLEEKRRALLRRCDQLALEEAEADLGRRLKLPLANWWRASVLRAYLHGQRRITAY